MQFVPANSCYWIIFAFITAITDELDAKEPEQTKMTKKQYNFKINCCLSSIKSSKINKINTTVTFDSY